MHRLALTAALTAGLAVAACKGRRTSAPPPPPSSADASVGPVVRELPPRPGPRPTPPPMPRELRASLLDAGAAPRLPRRYRAAPQPERTLTVTAALTERRYQGGAWIGPVEHPPLRDGFAVTRTADGTLAVRGLVGAVDAPDAAAAAPLLARWRTLLERRRLTVAVDDRGRMSAATFTDDPDRRRPDATLAEDEFAQRWLALAVPWPDEPIGLGARWRFIHVLRVGGVYLKQTATYTLEAIADDRLTVAIELERLGEPQALDLPGAPAELIALRRRLTGRVTVGATDPLPLAGQLVAEQSSHARVRGVGPVPEDELTDDRATLTLGE
ncbi:MAG: hypothetical protein KBI14_15645 [Kofleriaceae bacterium]|nr:hypothetical protein [Kofleriaceae bacterium]MBP9859833.1 hypothetical protein [Kofleriaceae bacterium]